MFSYDPSFHFLFFIEPYIYIFILPVLQHLLIFGLIIFISNGVFVDFLAYKSFLRSFLIRFYIIFYILDFYNIINRGIGFEIFRNLIVPIIIAILNIEFYFKVVKKKRRQ